MQTIRRLGRSKNFEQYLFLFSVLKRKIFVLFLSSICFIYFLNLHCSKGTKEPSGAEIVASIKSLGKPEFKRTQHPDAQWFPEAGFGLFMHWGIHSVKGLQPSWAMIKGYPYGGTEEYQGRKYNILAQQFNPQNYDPEKWIAAAAKAGFTYAVLTAKHHDGYALWPTNFGNFGTRQYMNGRDLLKPYVDACRKYGLKVGFYFSPRDWNFPGFPEPFIDFDYSNRDKPRPAILDSAANVKLFEKFYEYTVGQLYELLTRYGTIDLLWFDGIDWLGVADVHIPETLAWVRKLQPGIVTNNRWQGVGDYDTPEWNMPDKKPEGWWENCISWNGHWGYNPEGKFQTNSWVMQRLVLARSWGGNFLLNCGPAPDGTMQEGFYERCSELTQWMEHSRESLIGAGSVNWEKYGPISMTRRDKVWYVHILPDTKLPVVLNKIERPGKIIQLRTKTELKYTYSGKKLTINLPFKERSPLNEVIALYWSKEPE